eukprot:27550-Rhodomonas_salina.4
MAESDSWVGLQGGFVMPVDDDVRLMNQDPTRRGEMEKSNMSSSRQELLARTLEAASFSSKIPPLGVNWKFESPLSSRKDGPAFQTLPGTGLFTTQAAKWNFAIGDTCTRVPGYQ